jgi:hypothetical protein
LGIIISIYNLVELLETYFEMQIHFVNGMKMFVHVDYK